MMKNINECLRVLIKKALDCCSKLSFYSPSPQIHWRIACAVSLQHAGGGETLQPFLCGVLAQACHTLQVAAGEAGVGGEIVTEEREQLLLGVLARTRGEAGALEADTAAYLAEQRALRTEADVAQTDIVGTHLVGGQVVWSVETYGEREVAHAGEVEA